MTKEEIIQKLNQQDWWYQWSDDPLIYNTGYLALMDLLDIFRAEAKKNTELSDIIKEWHQVIQNRYVEKYLPHDMMKEFINEPIS